MTRIDLLPHVFRNKAEALSPHLLASQGPLGKALSLSNQDPAIPLPKGQAEQQDRFGVELKDKISQHCALHTLLSGPTQTLVSHLPRNTK